MRMRTCLLGLAIIGVVGLGSLQGADPMDHYNVVWQTPSESDRDSMPIGNGDIGINLWVEPSGDLLFYMSKTDSWGDNGRLLKLGRVRVKLSPNPFAGGQPFEQTLRLRQGEIRIVGGQGDAAVSVTVWVDAHHPVIYIDAESKSKFETEVHFETWREEGYKLEDTQISDLYDVIPESDGDIPNPYETIMYPDVIVPGETDRVIWYHHNVKSGWPVVMKHQGLGAAMAEHTDPLLGRTFGGAIWGQGMVSASDRLIKSAKAVKKLRVSIVAMTSHPSTPALWTRELDETIKRIDKLQHGQARRAHRNWWDDFWQRSWVRISGNEAAETVSSGYVLQRYMHACGGRGAQPIKFNGSIFTTPYHDDPDWRQWGPGFWWQNQRLIYWSMIAAGDYDLIQPFFEMYWDILPLCKARTRTYFGHGGAHYPECLYFWGTTYSGDYGWDREGKHVSDSADPYVQYEWQGGLELLAMMLDYYANTKDRTFLKERLLPMADEILTFYDKHYKRQANGRLRIWPAQALETWWECTGPMPEIAGLKFVMGKLLDLPNNRTSRAQRRFWKRLLAEVPAVPTRQEEGRTILAPAQEFERERNVENPELYAIFPYRLYGTGKDGLEMARQTFAHRRHVEGNRGHDQDDFHAAYLGLGELAGEMVTRRLGTEYLRARFPTFWLGYDWIPDHCHGGGGTIAVQAMLMQCEDKKILLLPAWPKDWDVDFKLNAPDKTTIKGSYKNGKLKYEVKPRSRRKDVVVWDAGP